ncbi:MAG: acireductone synthase [Pyrinomonadaceae bacterium]|nr:acireductone synthase [Pyrinomonadaceae bacterium]
MYSTILLDIEGTTTPIDFVHKILFPYAKERVRGYVSDNYSQLATEMRLLRGECDDDAEYASEITGPESAADYLEYLIDKDRKSTPLKTIQGLIWRTGYENGSLKAIVYKDVPDAFRRWTSKGKSVAIYSSGSVLAQKLLFAHTELGDLTEYISDYFDTHFGNKTAPKSYSYICSKLGGQAENVLFVSDSMNELEAAKAAGLDTRLSIRPGNEEVQDYKGHVSIETLDELE